MKIIDKINIEFQKEPQDFFIKQHVIPGTPIGLIDGSGKTIPLEGNQDKIPLTFTKFKQRGVTFSNRLVVSPMCTYSCQNGFLTDWHIAHYGGFAMHAPGAIMIEATAVQREGRISLFCSGLWSDEHIQSHQRVATIIKRQGVVPGIQLAHSGRKGSGLPPWISHSAVASKELGGWQDDVLAPSAIPFDDESAIPAAMTKAQIEETVNAFALAAIRADKAGYDFIELHAAHGYLISEFLSPNVNKRTDEYGGSFENRIRFLVEIVEKIKTVWPEDKPIWVRLSCSEWVEGGWDINDSVKLARIIKDLGVDLVDCSSGGVNVQQKIAAKPLFQVPFAEKIRKDAGIATGAVGIITTPTAVESILQQGKCDLVLAARQFLLEPSFVKRTALELGVDLKWNLQYERGKRNRL